MVQDGFVSCFDKALATVSCVAKYDETSVVIESGYILKLVTKLSKVFHGFFY